MACFGHILYAQNESNIWYFGGQAGVDFNGDTPATLNNGQMNTLEGTATISNSSGQLLFYTNGEKVWNRNHELMSNGTDLKGNSSSSQSCIIIPKPDSQNLYYIFTTDEFGNSNGLRYSEVDMSLANGFGNVNSNKNILLAAPTCEKLTAIRKSDSSGFWIVAHDYGSNKFMSYSVTNAGVNSIPIVSAVGVPITTPAGTVGYIKASFDGKKIVSCNYLKNLEILDFNALTGRLSNAKEINSKVANYSAEFSPSGKFLYVTTGSGNYIQEVVQYDLEAPNISASGVVLGTTNSQFGALQLASNGKIYVSLANSQYLGVVHDPENLGLNCSFEKDGIFIGPGVGVFGLPQPLPDRFSVFVASRAMCLGSSTQFTMTSNQEIISANWDFGDGITSTELSPSHIYTSTGTYIVRVIVQSVSGFTTQTSRVVISETPLSKTIKDKVVCASDALYNLAQNDIEIKGNQTNPLFKVTYFASQANASNHTSPLQSVYNLSFGTNIFFAKIYNSENINCHSITSFKITLLNEITPGSPTDYAICESPYDGLAQFDLAQKNNEVLNGLDPNLYTVTYYDDYDRAIEGLVSIPFLYTNSSSQQLLFARLESNLNKDCFAVTSFTVRVTELPLIGTLTDLVECGKKIEAFDLTVKNVQVLGNLSANSFVVKYYLTEQDAIDGDNPIVTPYFANTTNQTVYVAVRNNDNANCVAISSFNLIVLPTLPEVSPKEMNVCDDSSNDGIAVFDFEEQTAFLLSNQPSGIFDVTHHTSEADAQLGENAVDHYSNISNPQIIYTRVANRLHSSCFEVYPFAITVSSQPIIDIPGDLHLCSTEEGFTRVELFSLNEIILGGQSRMNFSITYHNSATDAQLGRNALPNEYEALIGDQTIYIRVENVQNSSCFTVAYFQIQVVPKPIIEMETNYALCENNSVEIIAPAGFDSYTWSTGETTSSIFVSSPGTITLTVGNNHEGVICSDIVIINVVTSSIAVIKEVMISDWTDNQNNIEVIVEGFGDYQYSIDGQIYQSSPKFYGLEAGEYTIYVRDINGCGIIDKQIYFLIYPKFFTPNGDGHNEKWHIKPSVLEPELKVYIFDSKGKLLTSLDGKSEGWDGTSNNHKLPSADYWFVVERKSGKTFKGHFSLMR